MSNDNDNTQDPLIGRVFDSSDLLTFIYNEAKKRMISPWAALGTVLTHTALAIPPGCRIPTRIGKATVPNLLLGYIAPPGGGKGISSSVIVQFTSDEINDDAYTESLRPVTPASGQAFAAAFVEWVPPRKANPKIDDPGAPGHLNQHSDARYFLWTEVDQLSAQMSSAGDSVSASLRVAFSGDGLGTFTKGKENQLHINEYEYRCVAAIHAQPRRCGHGIMDLSGGLAQRWVFLDADDPHRWISDEDWETRTVELPSFIDDDLEPRQFRVKPDILRQMQEDFRDRVYAENEWDQHRNVRRLKLAVLLAVMHGTMDVTDMEWTIAGAVIEHSDGVRDFVLGELDRAAQEDDLKAGARRAISEAGKRKTSSELREVAIRRIPRIVHAAGGSMAKSKVKRRLSGPQQAYFEEALMACVEIGEVAVDGARVVVP